MPLPNEDTPEWAAEVEFYINSLPDQRRQRAKELGYSCTNNYTTMMNKRNIHLAPSQTTPPITTTYKKPPDLSWEEHLRILQDMDKLLDFHIRTPDEVDLFFGTDLPIAITDSADWHLGQFGCDYASFERDIPIMEEEPGLYVNVGGDGTHNIIQAVKIGSSHNQAPIAVQKGLYALTLRRLVSKLGVLKSGNHFNWDVALSGEDWLGEKARHLKAVYIKDGGIINYHVGKQVYTHFTIHKGKFNSSFNLTHTCKQYQRLHCPQARIVTIEHHHVAAMEQYRYGDRECVAIRPGTYAVYDDYARQNGFFGAHVCNPTVVMYPDQDKIVGFKDMYDAIVYLRAVREPRIKVEI